jgi:hypothetical protein
MYQKKGAFVAAAFLLGTALGPSAPGIPSRENISADQVERGNERPAPTASKDTLGPSIEEAREMIIGTWIQDLSVKDQSINTPEKGPMRWVFTKDGTLKRYRRKDAGVYELDETVQYALVDKNPRTDQKASEASGFIAYLKTTQSDGDVEYSVVVNVKRKSDSSFLFIQFTGATITSVHFKPPNAFN